MDVDIDVTRSKAEGLPAIQQDRSFGKRFELLPTAVDFRFTSAAAPSNSGRNFRFRCLNSSSSSALQTTKNQPKIHQTLTIKKPKRPKPTKTNQDQPNPNKNQPKIHHEGTKTNQKNQNEPKINHQGTKVTETNHEGTKNPPIWYQNQAKPTKNQSKLDGLSVPTKSQRHLFAAAVTDSFAFRRRPRCPVTMRRRRPHPRPSGGASMASTASSRSTSPRSSCSAASSGSNAAVQSSFEPGG